MALVGVQGKAIEPDGGLGYHLGKGPELSSSASDLQTRLKPTLGTKSRKGPTQGVGDHGLTSQLPRGSEGMNNAQGPHETSTRPSDQAEPRVPGRCYLWERLSLGQAVIHESWPLVFNFSLQHEEGAVLGLQTRGPLKST